MNHDEVIQSLKDLRITTHSLFGVTRTHEALDYAIAYMEQKPTLFDDHVTDALLSHHTPEKCASLIRDMQAHIQKLEKGQSDDL